MRLSDIVASAREEISHEIGKNLDGGFALWKGRYVFVFDV